MKTNKSLLCENCGHLVPQIDEFGQENDHCPYCGYILISLEEKEKLMKNIDKYLSIIGDTQRIVDKMYNMELCCSFIHSWFMYDFFDCILEDVEKEDLKLDTVDDMIQYLRCFAPESSNDYEKILEEIRKELEKR